LIGFWAWDRFETGFTIFPFGFDSLELYAPFPPPGTPVKCRARVCALPDGQIVSDIQLAGPHGNVIAAIAGWKDMRLFDWSRAFARFVLDPAHNTFSEAWPQGVAGVGAGVECRRVAECGTGIWPRVLAHMILHPREREFFAGLQAEKRRREWLLGRMAVKDAVRAWIHKHRGVEMCPADIETVYTPSGQPALAEEFVRRTGVRLRISISHTRGVAIAGAAEDSVCNGIGIDFEARGESRDIASILTASECRLLDGLEEDGRQAMLLRIWCAKEAVWKAAGGGSIEARNVNRETGVVTVATPGGTVAAFTGTDEQYVFASAIV
jgi:phosphopantetheinyl transferase